MLLKKSIVKAISPRGANFQALVNAHHSYIRHACINALDDPTRPSGAPGYGIRPVIALTWYNQILKQIFYPSTLLF